MSDDLFPLSLMHKILSAKFIALSAVFSYRWIEILHVKRHKLVFVLFLSNVGKPLNYAAYAKKNNTYQKRNGVCYT